MSADFAVITVNGRKKAVFSVAVNRRFKNKTSGEWDKKTTYIDIVAWGLNADHVIAHGKKGAKVALTANWETDRYMNKDNEEVKRTHGNITNVSIFTARDESVNAEVSSSDEVPF